MQVILREDIEKVGLRGEVVDVAPGFARNYLLPRKLAEPAAPGRVAEIEKLATKRSQHEAQSFEQAQELVQKLEGTELRFDVQAGETGTLFGSVTSESGSTGASSISRSRSSGSAVTRSRSSSLPT